MAEMLLEMKNIEKIFAHVHALNHVNFDIKKGEVVSLLGENGAGKSTLIKILTGVYPKDGGEIIFDGKPVEIGSKHDAEKLGIAVIFQELSLIPTLSVTQNIMLGKETSTLGIIHHRPERKRIAELIKMYDFPLEESAIVETLSVAQKQMVEILKALSTDARLIIMDEPTASLSRKESEVLYKIIYQLKEKGVSIIYISHRLEEVFSLADRISILRDGKNVGVVEKKEIVPNEVVKLMIGKQLSEATASRPLRTSDKEVVLEVKNLTHVGYYEDVNFQVHAGEVLVLTGLVGAGRTEVVRSIFGADPYDSGEILYRGEPLKKNSISDAVGKGFGLIPEDRRTQGFSPLLSVSRNVAVTNYDRLAKHGFVNRKKEDDLGKEVVEMVDLRPANPDVAVGNLSGGNQQKAVLGKWLTRDLKVILIDEPTVGIDIGAKEEIYEFIEKLASQGIAVLMVSSDIAEVLRVAHRIIVMREGHVIREFNDGAVTQEQILLAQSGLQADAKEVAQGE